MGARTSYAPGTFSWVDLTTPDAGAAKAFYGELFGWDADGSTTWRLDGDAVSGLARPSTPSRWRNYVTVTDVAATVERAQALGGRATGVADVGDAGRTALVTDPDGAELALWEPRGRIGAERVNDVGFLCMNELVTAEIGAAREFYEGLFGWRTEIVDTGPLVVFAYNGETLNAAFLEGPAGEPPYWRPCFTVASTEAAAERVRALGGTVLVEPEDNADGRVAVARDPHGARFSVFAGDVDP